MLTYEEALDTVVSNVSYLGYERVHALEALGRVVAELITAPWDIPMFDNSAMDGYAVRFQDIEGKVPVSLTVKGHYYAGNIDMPAAEPGCAYKVMTGAAIPRGCDTVVPVENTKEGNSIVQILAPQKGGTNIRYQGEDFRAGKAAISDGTVLRPPEINIIASFNKAFVSVYRKAKVAVLATGDELQEFGSTVKPGKIIESNSLSLTSAIIECGAEPILLGIASDNRESLREKIMEGLKADALVTTAGVSVGDRDLVRSVLEDLGAEQVFWQVNIKPGRPVAFSMKQRTPVFSLPGNPVSTLLTFELFVRPALLKMMGHRHFIKPFIKASLQEPISKKSSALQLLRVRVDIKEGTYVVRSSGDQKPGILKSLSKANGIAFLRPDRIAFTPGEQVDVLLLY